MALSKSTAIEEWFTVIKNFGIKKEYVTRTVSKERDIRYISAADIRCFINQNSNLIVAHSTSNYF
jgi:hypothetical protein